MSYKSDPQECGTLLWDTLVGHFLQEWTLHTRVSYKSVLTRVSYKSVPQESCPIRVSHKSVPQECPTRVSYKSVPQECCPITRVSHKSVQECPTRVSYKSVPQECSTRVSLVSCPTRVSQKSVPQECPTRVSCGNMLFFERVYMRVRGFHLVLIRDFKRNHPRFIWIFFLVSYLKKSSSRGMKLGLD